MTEPEKARVFIVGHAAALVRETEAQGKVKNAKYEETLKKIDADARKALDAIKGQVPEAAALLGAADRCQCAQAGRCDRQQGSDATGWQAPAREEHLQVARSSGGGTCDERRGADDGTAP